MIYFKNSPKASLLQYYQDYSFNPVPIKLENKSGWRKHLVKRNNLYEKHLSIPLLLFSKASVLEFGCNSGENALHLAHSGAKLTLVEPNNQVLPRLKTLFKKFGLEKNITALINKDIAGFKSQKLYDLMIAEGFLNTLSNREEMFLKICRFIKKGGLGVISFDDRYGCFLEVTRQMLLKRACQLRGISDSHSKASLETAKQLYGEDFSKINASRPFSAWWEDALINPFVSWKHLWTYKKFIPLLEEAKCEFLSSSPKWASINYYSWYKNVPANKNRHKHLMENWHKNFSFFLTGLPLYDLELKTASDNTVEAVSQLIKAMSEYIKSDNTTMINFISYPCLLDKYLKKHNNHKLSSFNTEMKRIFDTLKTSNFNKFIGVYHNTKYVRNLWGVPCPYICFKKLP